MNQEPWVDTPSESTRWSRKFAWHPVKTFDKGWIWWRKYYLYEKSWGWGFYDAFPYCEKYHNPQLK